MRAQHLQHLATFLNEGKPKQHQKNNLKRFLQRLTDERLVGSPGSVVDTLEASAISNALQSDLIRCRDRMNG